MKEITDPRLEHLSCLLLMELFKDSIVLDAGMSGNNRNTLYKIVVI